MRKDWFRFVMAVVCGQFVFSSLALAAWDLGNPANNASFPKTSSVPAGGHALAAGVSYEVIITNTGTGKVEGVGGGTSVFNPAPIGPSWFTYVMPYVGPWSVGPDFDADLVVAGTTIATHSGITFY